MMTLYLDALNGHNYASRPPIWIMRQAGRYMPSYRALREKHSFLTICHEPDLISQVTHLPIAELDFDAAIVFSDILLLLESMGFKVEFDDGVGPMISNHLKTPHEVFNLSHEWIEQNYLSIAIQQLKGSLKVPLIGFVGAPFTLASYLIEGKTSRNLHLTKVWSYQHALEFQHLIQLLTKNVIASLKTQIEAGCDAVQIFDSWAHVLTDHHFNQFSLTPLKKIIEALKPYKVPITYFCKGSAHLAPLIAKTGVSAVSIDWTRPLSQVRNHLPHVALQGNLDPEALYLPIPDLQKEVNTLLNSMHCDPAYIFNLGHGILPNTPYENVQSLIETVKLH